MGGSPPASVAEGPRSRGRSRVHAAGAGPTRPEPGRLAGSGERVGSGQRAGSGNSRARGSRLRKRFVRRVAEIFAGCGMAATDGNPPDSGLPGAGRWAQGRRIDPWRAADRSGIPNRPAVGAGCPSPHLCASFAEIPSAMRQARDAAARDPPSAACRPARAGDRGRGAQGCPHPCPREFSRRRTPGRAGCPAVSNVREATASARRTSSCSKPAREVGFTVAIRKRGFQETRNFPGFRRS